MLRRIFGPNKEEVEKIRNFIICVSAKHFKGIKSRHMRWPGYVFLIREMRNA
jgi:hypothetical protein